MGEVRKEDLSLEGFLDWENRQPERFERVGGVVRMMAGGTLGHDQIAANIVGELRTRLRGGHRTGHLQGGRDRGPAPEEAGEEEEGHEEGPGGQRAREAHPLPPAGFSDLHRPEGLARPLFPAVVLVTFRKPAVHPCLLKTPTLPARDLFNAPPKRKDAMRR